MRELFRAAEAAGVRVLVSARERGRGFRIERSIDAIRVFEPGDVLICHIALSRGRIESTSGILGVPHSYRLQAIVSKLLRDDASHTATCPICSRVAS